MVDPTLPGEAWEEPNVIVAPNSPSHLGSSYVLPLLPLHLAPFALGVGVMVVAGALIHGNLLLHDGEKRYSDPSKIDGLMLGHLVTSFPGESRDFNEVLLASEKSGDMIHSFSQM
ncbi:hypothetical protein FF1_006694 [Malus domestica]